MNITEDSVYELVAPGMILTDRDVTRIMKLIAENDRMRVVCDAAVAWRDWTGTDPEETLTAAVDAYAPRVSAYVEEPRCPACGACHALGDPCVETKR